MLQLAWPTMTESAPTAMSDRELARYLIAKYDPKDLLHLLQEEGLDEHSPSMEYSSTNLFEAVSVDSTHIPRSFQDGIKIEPTDCVPSPSRLRRECTASHHSWGSPFELSPTRPTTSSSRAMRRSAVRKQLKPRGQFVCGFCSEEGVQTTCTRKNDLKRHIEGYHHLNAQWICQVAGCDMTFDWEKGYKTHLKSVHGGAALNPDEAKSILCPQTVFACGFEKCLQVFEATGDHGVNVTFKDYLNHLMKHYDEGPTSGSWTYTARMRNLLRQSLVNNSWVNSSWLNADPNSKNQLTWSPHNTGILRKILETRHITNAEQLVNYAVDLSRSPKESSPLQRHFQFPIKGMCAIPVVGHINSAPPQPTTDRKGKQKEQHQPVQLPSPSYYASNDYSLRPCSMPNYTPRQPSHVPPTAVSGFVSSPESSYGGLQQSPPTSLFNDSPCHSGCMDWQGDVDSPEIEAVDRHHVSFGEPFMGRLQSPALTEL